MRKEFDLVVESRKLYEGLVEECCRLKKYDHALYYCNSALSHEPNDIDLLYTKVLILYKSHKFNEALETLELVGKYDVDNLYGKDSEIIFYSIRSILLYL
jgi:tetratricopeptide (TPR) repeat protein